MKVHYAVGKYIIAIFILLLSESDPWANSRYKK